MKKFTIPELAEKLKLSKERIWVMIAEGALETIVEDKRLYVVLPDFNDTSQPDVQAEPAAEEAPKADEVTTSDDAIAEVRQDQTKKKRKKT